MLAIIVCKMTSSQQIDTGAFEAQLRRLKAALGVREDQDAAEALGLTKAALSLRKRRGAFPTGQLLALSARRPELLLDVAHIVTGVASTSSPLTASGLRRAQEGSHNALQRRVLAEVALQDAESRRQRRHARAAAYESILGALDTASDETVATVLHVADRMAQADRAAELGRTWASAEASESKGQPGQGGANP